MTIALIFGALGFACGVFSLALLIAMCMSAARGDRQIEPGLRLVWDANDDHEPEAA